MKYKNELDFMLNVFNKSQISVRILDENNKKNSNKDNEKILNNLSLFTQILPFLQENRLYKYTDGFELCYRFLLLPNTPVKTALFIGPFLKKNIDEGRILEASENNSFSPLQHKLFLELASSLPILPDNSPLLTMLNTFCETIWDTPSFTITDFSEEEPSFDPPFSKTLISDEPFHEMITKETFERRYDFENQLIRAVSLGQQHLESQFMGAFSNDLFEKRSSDPLQNAKNYCIIMNTLLRKGAEQGGVHPFYLNQISTDYALKIENLSFYTGVSELMKEMFRTYCRLVRKHNIRKYTPVVQKTILFIDGDLSNDLSSKTLALHQGVSLGYLSSVFRKETGHTISEHVAQRRMDYAEYLLNTTNLQIQTIALHCGIMDVQYFSKLFKKIKGKSPSKFRRQQK